MISQSPPETHQIGDALGKLLRAGDVLLLQGPLGAGKTALTQGIASGMGVTAAVTSPTFVLVNQYPGPLTLYHVDLYRIEGAPEAEDLGLDDYFFGDGVTVVEWPERAPAAMPPEHLLIRLDHAGDTSRDIRFEASGERYRGLLDGLTSQPGAAVPQTAGSAEGHCEEPPAGGRPKQSGVGRTL
jgi:tRNA threonylcarbamoyladenosine biosynthesis protein TsaE